MPTNEDILCEAPGPDGMYCTLPYGHPPEQNHAYEIQLPSFVGKMIEQYIDDLEKQTRRMRQAKWLFLGGVIFYLALTFAQIIW